MEIIGRQVEMGVGVEETRGTPQGTAEKWIKKITANIVERSEKKVDESTVGRLEDSLGARVVKKWVEGDLEGNLHVDAIGYFLYNLYGAVSSSVASGSVYDHVFTMSNGITHASLTLFLKDGSVDQQVYDTAMLSALEVSAAIDDYVKFTASFMASGVTANSDTPSYDTEYDFIARDIIVKFADTEVGLATATAVKLKDINIKWDTGLISDHVVGSYFPDDIYNAKMSIEGDFNLNFADQTYKDLYLGDDYKYMEIAITGATDIGGGEYPTFKVTLNRVQIMDWNREDSADELVNEPVSFKAFYNESDSEQSSVTLTNLTEEYDEVISA